VSVEVILARLTGIQKQKSNEWIALCPGHEDHDPSLLVTRCDDGKVLVHCRAKCFTPMVLRALHLTLADLHADIQAVFDYHRADGTLAYQIVRQQKPGQKKAFSARQWSGEGQTYSKVPPEIRLPYRLPQLAGRTHIAYVEGEKCADAVWRVGFPATTHPFGAQGFEQLASRYIQILVEQGVKTLTLMPDHDATGYALMHDVGKAALVAGLEVRWLALYADGLGAEKGADVADWLENTTVGNYSRPLRRPRHMYRWPTRPQR
jgi:hypothetical protein